MMGRRERIPHYDGAVEVGTRLRAARLALRLSQRELSFPGCSAAYISRIEQGERVPSLQVMRELARRVGVTENLLAYGEERIDGDVVRMLNEIDAAGSSAQRAHGYRALARAASKAARELERR
jgi:transcriptional regulator with XRE-family HTH domain